MKDRDREEEREPEREREYERENGTNGEERKGKHIPGEMDEVWC